MPLYIGVIEHNTVNRLYISSVPVEDDRFETEHVMADCSSVGALHYPTALTDLRILRNKLANGDVPHEDIVVETDGAV